MYKNVLWIDPEVRDYQVFVDSVNADTLAIVYPEPLRGFVQANVERIGFVFEKHGPMANYLLENASVLIGLGVKHMDFLACDTLPEWQPYYDTLTEITVGASNNRTGNLQYGGDWLMESTFEDVEKVYFTRSIEYYKYLLIGFHSSLAIDISNNLLTCGDNGGGQLGRTNTTTYNASFTSSNLSNVLLCRQGYLHSLALDYNGTLWACGYHDGRIGRTTNTNVFDKTTLLTDVVDIAGGDSYSLALVGNTIWSCGVNATNLLGVSIYYGLGREVTNNASVFVSTNVSNIYSIDSGFQHSLALNFDGTILSCGDRSSGQLGQYPTPSECKFFKQVPNINNVTSIACGNWHSLIIINNTVYSCGLNATGQLGRPGGGNTEGFLITNMTNTKKVDGGYDYSIALDNTGTVWSCGFNGNGRLGRSGNSQTSTDSLFISTNFTNVKDIAAHGAHTIVLKNDNTIWSCGFNENGQLGRITTNNTTNNTFLQCSGTTQFKGLSKSRPYEGISYSINKTTAIINSSVNLVGNNFGTNTYYLKIGNTSVDISVLSDTQIQFRVPNVVQTNASIDLYTSQGTFRVPTAFTIPPLFNLSRYNPSSVIPRTQIQLIGSNFSDISYVRFGGQPIFPTAVTSTQINVSVPVGLEDQVTVTVFDLYGNNASLETKLNVLNMSVTTFEPTSAPQKSTISLTGSNLSNLSSVRFGSFDASYTWLNETNVTVRVPDGIPNNCSVGVYDIYGNNASYASTFTNTTFTLSTFAPTSAPEGATLTLNGNNLSNLSSVTFVDTDVETDVDTDVVIPATGLVRVNDQQLTLTVPPFTPITEGQSLYRRIRIQDLYQNESTYSVLFEYRNPEFQDITPMGRENDPCIIRGNDLQGLDLYLNGQFYESTKNISTLTFGFPARGTYTVELRSEYTTLNVSSIVSLGGPVTIQQILPAYGPGRSSSVILGTNVDYTTQVTFGNASAPINYKSIGYVNVSIPPGTDEVPVTVYDIQNVSYPAGTYTYRNPNASSMTKESRIGATVTITGINLARSSKVLFQGLNLSVQKTNTSVTFVVPDSSGNASVILVDDVGNQTYPGEFNYINPSILYTDDFSGQAGQEIVIEGTYLNYTEYVKFGVRNASFVYEEDLHPAGRLRITVPMGQKQRTITLVEGINEMTYPTKFQYTQYSSILIDPLYGKANSSVKIQLINIGNVSQVRMGPYILDYGLDYVPGTDLQIQVPHLTGVVPIEVIDADGEIMSAPFRYESIVISEISPTMGVASTVLFVKGSKFSAVSRVQFGTTLAEFTYLTDTFMKVTVPSDLPEFSTLFFYDSMENLGTYSYFQTLYSSSDSFTQRGYVGDTFEVFGKYLNTMKAITFNGVPAKSLVVTDTKLTCTIPYGITSPDILMIDRKGTAIDIALSNSDPEHTFTYLPPIPKTLKQGEVSCVATDKGRLYLSSGKTVTSDGHIYTHSEIILGMVVDDSILYLCDGTNYIVRYHIATRRSLPRYIADRSVIAIKRYQGRLYALSNRSLTPYVAPRLTVFGDTTQVIPLPDKDYQGLAVDTFLYLTYFLDYDLDDVPEIDGGVSQLDFSGNVFALEFITGLNAPKDLLVVYPYLYIDGPYVYQYNLTTLSLMYQTSDSGSNYSSLAYAQDTLYLANSGQSLLETLPAPVVPNLDVICLTMTPTGMNQSLVEITGLNLNRIFTILFDHQSGTELTKVSTTYLSFRAPVGTGSPVIELLNQKNERIPHHLTFTYKNVNLYQVCPRQGVEQQNLYLFGENFENVREVYIGNTRVDASLVHVNTLHVLTPAGSGVAEIRLIDLEGNRISYPSITFSYNIIYSVICFQRGTLIYSDQGAIEIQNLVPHVHTIYGQPIQAITATYYNEKHMIRIEPHALGPDCPSEVTYISRLHKIFFQGRMIPSYRFISRPGFSWVPYDGEKLYNVLLYREGRMNVQGMVCETLDPRNPVAEMFTSIINMK